MIYGMKRVTGDYQIEGPSYAALQDILRGTDTELWFFALLFAAKIIATTLTLASGGSGGVFSASLIIGAALGGIVGDVTQMLMPQLHVNLPDYAIVGMAGTRDGGGYWLFASDGGVFNYGDALFSGSAASLASNNAAVGGAGSSS